MVSPLPLFISPARRPRCAQGLCVTKFSPILALTPNLSDGKKGERVDFLPPSTKELPFGITLSVLSLWHQKEAISFGMASLSASAEQKQFSLYSALSG